MMPQHAKRITFPLQFSTFQIVANVSDAAKTRIDELIFHLGNVGGEVLGREFSRAAIMVL